MVTLTPSAVATLERVLAGNAPAAKGLRIAVTDGGCAGHKYQMGLEADAGEGDAVFEFGSVLVYVDEASQPLLDGVVVDFVEGIEGSGFKFENPNATGTCGCGKSFSSSGCAPAPGSAGSAGASSCGTAH